MFEDGFKFEVLSFFYIFKVMFVSEIK